MNSNKLGLSPIIVIIAVAIFGFASLPVVASINEVSAPTPSPTDTATPAESPVPSPTDTPSPNPTPTPSPSPVTSNQTGSYTHVYTNTNGVVHDVTVSGNDSYNLDEGGTSIHINNNSN